MLALVATGIITARATRIYTSSVTLFVSTAGSAQNVASLYDGGLAAQQRVQSYADLVSSERVASEVIRRLGLTDTPGELAGRISGHAVTDTVLLRASVRDRDPGEAQLIANEVGAVFTTEIAKVEAPADAAAGGTGTPTGPTGPAAAGAAAGAAPGDVSASPVRVSVWEAAKRPGHPVSPNVAQNIALGLLAGIALGIGLAVTRHRLDTTVKSAQDVTAAADLPTIGLIAYDRTTRSQPLTVVDRPRLPRAEAFRQLRTNLQFIGVDARPRLITITSCRSSDGKTTTALNLAAALAQSGARVVAVEADLRRPSFGPYLGIEPAGGLTSILAGQARPGSVMQPIAKGQVLAITSGRVPPNPSEILGSMAMSDLLAELREEFDYVIIDAPPLLAVTDAAVVSALTDGTILIARAGRTRRVDLAHAGALLRNVDANILGVVLNMVPTRGPDAYSYTDSYTARRGQHQARSTRVIPAIPRRRRDPADQTAEQPLAEHPAPGATVVTFPDHPAPDPAAPADPPDPADPAGSARPAESPEPSAAAVSPGSARP
jgi:non-specific protein-tyrosine kinase